MGAAIVWREDYDASDLRQIAKRNKNAAQSPCLLALAEIYAGGSAPSTMDSCPGRTVRQDDFVTITRRLCYRKKYKPAWVF